MYFSTSTLYRRDILAWCVARVEAYQQREDELTMFIKFSRTTVVVNVLPTDDICALKMRFLDALVASHQPDDAVLGRPFADAKPSDMSLYTREEGDQAEPTYTILSVTGMPASDETKLTAVGATDGAVLYVGFQGLPVVQDPQQEEIAEEPNAVAESSEGMS